MGKKDRSDAVTTLIGSDAGIEGAIEFDGAIRVDGRVTGRIHSAGGTLIVGEGAVIQAEIEVDSAILMGEINGTIVASDRIQAYPPCRINGDIRAPVISIEPGVVFNGTCSMKSSKVTPLPQTEPASFKGTSE